jgi:hypothetical protein
VRGKWLQRVRQLHLFLGVFFSPLLLLFIITGWWQTFATQDDDAKAKGLFTSAMSRVSTIHTDDYFTVSGDKYHASEHFKILVGGMAAALILTIVLGLALACQTAKKAWLTAIAFTLGIAVPALVLYFN